MSASAVLQTSDFAPDSGTVDAIVGRVRERHLQRLDVLERAVLALMDGTLTDTLREHAEQEAHTLAGAMPTFGLPTGARLARALEQSFAARYALDRSVATRLADQVVALRSELERPVASTPAASVRVARECFVLLTETVDRAEHYLAEGLTCGVDVHWMAHESPVDDVRRLAPRAVVIELPSVISLPWLASLRRLARVGVPTLVVGGTGVLQERIAIARCGAVGPVPLPVSPSEVLQRAAALKDEQRVPRGTVLVVDTDPYACQLARIALERAGHLVYTLFDPVRVWETLEMVVPELMIVGAQLGVCSGVDVSLATRADPRWRDLPVMLAVTSYEDAAAREAYCAGIDDVVRKPLDPRLLQTRVSNRLRLSRALRRRDDTDPVTGLASRSKGERELERLLRLARRHEQRFAFLLFRIDRFSDVRSRHGQAAADSALRRLAQLLRDAFRGEDVIARWSASEIAVGLFDADEIIARERSLELLHAMRTSSVPAIAGAALTVTCSAGIAAAPDVAADLVALHAAADSAFLLAGAHATDDVFSASRVHGEHTPSRVDVLLVDEDPATASLVMHALEARRYSVRWIRDGAEAAAALTGDKPLISARVVLMEVNLSTLDGLSVLRALAAAQALRRTRVVMLSQRTSDAETLQAFELGAFDYVAKPFSVAVLAERVRRALVA